MSEGILPGSVSRNLQWSLPNSSQYLLEEKIPSPRVWFWSFKLMLAVFHLVFKCSTAICRYCSWLTFMVDCSNSKFLFLAPCLLCLLHFLGDTLHLLFSFKAEQIYIYLLTFFPQQKCHLSYTSLR